MTTARFPGRSHLPHNPPRAELQRRILRSELSFVADQPAGWHNCEMDCPIAPRVDGSLPKLRERPTRRDVAAVIAMAVCSVVCMATVIVFALDAASRCAP